MVRPITLKIRAKKLGVLLRDARLSTGKSMKECAEILGISSAKIGTFERGDKSPSLPELEILAFFLDIPLEHFWSQASRFTNQEERFGSTNLARLIPLRQRILGARLRKARTEDQITQKALAQSVGITPARLKSYETGEQPIPLPELEGIAAELDLPIEHFLDKDGKVGQWAAEQRAIQQFLSLPKELQEFITKPVNTPYLDVAQRMSGLSVEQLRAIAEGLLDITL
jgi:transcriptional regulator with XRE-family HTH domain